MIWRNLGLIALFLIGCLLLTMLWLRWYTHHGQSLVLPDYVDQHVDDATNDAKEHSFQIRVIDSVYIVGKKGGVIVDQNPVGASKVKEKRKIYVTISKYDAVQIPLRRLPVLYGKSYDRKQKELAEGFEIQTKIAGKKYDAGAPNHILEVIYKGETIIDADRRKDNVLIDKGGTLEVIISKITGGSLTMPNLACNLYDEAVFQLQALQLFVGDEVAEADVVDRGAAYVWKQYPDANSRVYTGDTVTLYITGSPPADCNN